MLLRLTEIKLTLHEDESLLPQKVAERLSITAADIKNIRIIRKSLDARKKDAI